MAKANSKINPTLKQEVKKPAFRVGDAVTHVTGIFGYIHGVITSVRVAENAPPMQLPVAHYYFTYADKDGRIQVLTEVHEDLLTA